jgi:hypothetical protein
MSLSQGTRLGPDEIVAPGAEIRVVLNRFEELKRTVRHL